MTNFHDLLAPYAASRFMNSGEAPAFLIPQFRRDLDLYGIRPVGGNSHEGLLDRLVNEDFGHISELYPALAYQECPAWDARVGPYEPDPVALSLAQEAFEEAKGLPASDGDELDNVTSDIWDSLYKLGKPALLIYCRNYPQAWSVQTPVERGEIIRCFFETISGQVSRIARIPDLPRLLRSLRVPADDWPPAGETPFGLLKRLSQEIGKLDRSFQVPDPMAWWHANESYIPDLWEVSA